MALEEPLLPDLSGAAQASCSATVGAANDVEDGAAAMLAAHSSGVSAPLLVRLDKVEGALIAIEDDARSRWRRSISPLASDPQHTFWPCVFNLAKVIMGAGMMAVPKAYYLLGWLAGTVLLLAIGGLTYFSLAGLLAVTDAGGPGAPGSATYALMARRWLGRSAERALQLAVFANCWVMEVVFLVVIADILVGAAESGAGPPTAGLLCELLGVCSGPLVDRRLVLALLCAGVLLPLAAMRSMERLAPVNVVGVLSNAGFALVTVALAAAAAAQGRLHPIPWDPDWQVLRGDGGGGGSGGGGPLRMALSLAAIAPVLLNCDTCHQSLHPLRPLLRPYSTASMCSVVAAALGVCNLLYLTIAVCACLAFGPDVSDDILNNVSAASMAPLLGGAAARMLAACLRVGYLCSLTGSYVLLCFPLRAILGTALPAGRGGGGGGSGCEAAAARLEAAWLPVTAGLVASSYVVAVFLPTIWGALTFIGATASSVQAFIVPGCTILAADALLAGGLGGGSTKTGPLARWSVRLLAGLVAVVGVLLFANGVVHQAMSYVVPPSGGGAGGEVGVGSLVGMSLGLPFRLP